MELDVLGYNVCGCGEWFVPVRGAGADLCGQCLIERGRAAGQVIDVDVLGHVISLGKRKRSRRRGSYKDPERELAVSRARHRAIARLVATNRSIYEAMVAEELAKMGQPPIRTRADPLRMVNRVALDALEADLRERS